MALGAVDGGSPAGVAEAADIVFLCVPSSPQVAEVVADMLPALGPGQVVVDCSTIDPEVTRAQHALVDRRPAPATSTPRCRAGPPGPSRGRSP